MVPETITATCKGQTLMDPIEALYTTQHLILGDAPTIIIAITILNWILIFLVEMCTLIIHAIDMYRPQAQRVDLM
jgi:myosin-crossreactive antigen